MRRLRSKFMFIVCFALIVALMIPQSTYALSNPSVPTGLTAAAVSGSQINLSWKGVGEASQYYIYRSNSASGVYTYVGAVTGTNYSNTGLTPMTTYYYKVQAINSAGSSDYSSPAWAVTPAELDTSSILSDRISGSDRYETSANIAEMGWTASDYAILASGENYPDALCAAPLAAKFDAPILLTSKNKLEEETKGQFSYLNVKKVIIVGGEGVISAKVEQSIKNLGIEVSRAAGLNRYETSLLVAKMMGNFDEAVIATGEDFADILSIAPIAAQKGMPILLTPGNSLSKNLKDILSTQARKTYVLGDISILSDAVVNQLPAPQRLGGSNRYDANTQIIQYFANDLDLSTCYAATGEAYPDALSGSVLASLSKSPVLLVKKPLPSGTEKLIENNASRIQKIVAFGGTGAVSDSLLESLTQSNGAQSGSLAAPANVVANPLGTGQIHLSWNAVSNASSYAIYRSTSYSGTYNQITTVGVPYYTDANLSSGVTYYYKIKAVNSSAASAFSNSVQAATLTDTGFLQAPDNFTVTPLSSKEIYLTWSPVDNAFTYNIYRTTADTGNYVLLASVNRPYYTDESVTLGTTYFYKVQAAYSGGTGPYSKVGAGAPLLKGDTLTVPANVTASGIDSASIMVTWGVVNNATYYQVYRSTSFSGTYSIAGTSPLTYLIDEGLVPGMTYYYKVQAVSSAGLSDFSTIAYAVTGAGAVGPAAPDNLVATVLGSSQIYLTWNGVYNATHYKIYRSTSSSGTYTLIDTIVNPYYTDRNLTPGTTYYYYIQAGGDFDTSPKSNTVHARTSN
ncbi:cell wall-binding repeat-containing protein [Desulfitobacterium chlororespirans]|uniref:Putative cell wall-binding protein n=1 Tax=Desulfitobacterium chlororespirans DSM 11544 TaxID=1121395 RepID=A0A1M7U9A7_9FIRM|nr:cell wall-binding repeat-containing protein [Desulfitobacterium chlororespirans]SHN79467.1 Putative cell wall-binding protein [Desulfitobacterium chlororespirans DSM 11544]